MMYRVVFGTLWNSIPVIGQCSPFPTSKTCWRVMAVSYNHFVLNTLLNILNIETKRTKYLPIHLHHDFHIKVNSSEACKIIKLKHKIDVFTHLEFLFGNVNVMVAPGP